MVTAPMGRRAERLWKQLWQAVANAKADGRFYRIGTHHDCCSYLWLRYVNERGNQDLLRMTAPRRLDVDQERAWLNAAAAELAAIPATQPANR